MILIQQHILINCCLFLNEWTRHLLLLGRVLLIERYLLCGVFRFDLIHRNLLQSLLHHLVLLVPVSATVFLLHTLFHSDLHLKQRIIHLVIINGIFFHDHHCEVIDLRFLLYELLHGLLQTYLVVQTGRLDYRSRINVRVGGRILIEYLHLLFHLYLTALYLYLFDYRLRRVLQYDQLMVSDPIQHSSFLIRVHLQLWTMHLLLTPVCRLVHNTVDILFLATALILISLAPWRLDIHLWLHRLRMELAVVHLSHLAELLTTFALEHFEVGPHLPIYLFP